MCGLHESPRKPQLVEGTTLNLRAPRSISKVVVVAIATVGFTAVLPVVQAAAATIQYQAVTTIAPAPPAQFQGAGGGDGWGLAFTPTEVFNVFHHQPTLQVECHVEATAAQCSSNTFPVTITDDSADQFATDNFATSAQPAVWIDQTTGDLYVYATATGSAGNGTAGVVCVDTSSTAADPFCGFTPLSAVGDAPTTFGGISAVSAGLVVGNDFYAFNYVSSTSADFPPAGLGTTNTMMCFNLTTFGPCSAQPYAVDYGAGNDVDGGFPVPAVSTVGSDIIVPVTTDSSGPQLTCFDTTTDATCTGAWPIPDPEGSVTPNGAALPVLDASGNPIGFCLRTDVVCFDVTGASIPAPAGMSAMPDLTGNGSGWIGNPVVLGDRVIFAWVSGADCYDYATGAECANYPIALPNYLFGYTMNLDPNRPGCIWGNADSGSGQIQNFDAYSTGACGSDGDRVLLNQLIPTGVTCQPTSYSTVTILSPAASTYTGGTIQFEDVGGSDIGTPVSIDSNGVADISGLGLSALSALPQALIDLPGAPSVPVEVEVSWQGSDALACDLAPEPPQNVGAVAVSAGAGSNQGNYTISWTAPAFDGGTPITGYTVTGLPGGATCTTTTALTCDIDGLPDTSNFTFNVVATNAVGDSSPATTAPAGLVAGPAVSTAPPIVSGALTVGDTMSSTTGSWAVDQASFTYQWYSCTDIPITTPAVDTNCTAVGTNSATYVTQPTDGGNYIADVVSDLGTDGSTTSASSNVLGPVTGPALQSTAPVISGTTNVGLTLSSTTGGWVDANGTYAYKWYSCTDVPAGNPSVDPQCTKVGANASTYVVAPSDLGHHVVDLVTATGTDLSTASAWSNVLGPVVGPAVNFVRPSIGGPPWVGQVLVSSNGIWANAASLAFQWYSCADLPTATPATDAKCTAVGTNATTYKLVAGDVGHHIVEVVTGTGTDNSTLSLRSNVLGPVLAKAPTPPVAKAYHLKMVVLFAENSTALTATYMARLDAVANAVVAHHVTDIHLVGCTDRLGSRAYNVALSVARTDVVRAYLLKALAARHDTDVRITTLGVGVIVKYKNLALDRRVNVTT
jgi:outer membrane protein OmpA-like peptidoglycan-associated protein